MKDYRKLYKEHYGIDFGSEYVIHHIDENRENNNVENLILLPRELHSRFHEATRECRYAKDSSSIELWNIDATPNSAIKFDYFGSFYQKFLSVMNELRYWIEIKATADLYIRQGTKKYGYQMFRGEF